MLFVTREFLESITSRTAGWLALPLLLVPALAATADDAPLVKARLELYSATVLAGVPFDLSVTFTNTSDRTVSIGSPVAVRMGAVGEAPQLVDKAGSLGIACRDGCEIEPRSETIASIDWNSNLFWSDGHFSEPGTYAIALDIREGQADPDEGIVAAGPIQTQSITITRTEPAGDDAVVWRELQRTMKERHVGPAAAFGWIGKWIIDEHPDSAYYPYALVLGRRPDGFFGQHLAKLQPALDRFRDSPAYPHLLQVAAGLAHLEAFYADSPNRDRGDIGRWLAREIAYEEEVLRLPPSSVRDEAALLKRSAESTLERVNKGGHVV